MAGYCTVTLVNNTIVDNIIMLDYGNSGGIYAYPLYSSFTGDNNIIYFNHTGLNPNVGGDQTLYYSCWAEAGSGSGNISADPQFVDTSQCDFHLASTSPCIDAGNPLSPFDPDSTIADMGVFYFDQTQGVNPGQQILLPTSFALDPVHPNPFNPTTALSYKLQATSHVSLKVYDTAGRQMATLVEGVQEAGQHHVTFDGSKLASGLYFVRMQAGRFIAVQKLILMK